VHDEGRALVTGSRAAGWSLREDVIDERAEAAERQRAMHEPDGAHHEGGLERAALRGIADDDDGHMLGEGMAPHRSERRERGRLLDVEEDEVRVHRGHERDPGGGLAEAALEEGEPALVPGGGLDVTAIRPQQLGERVTLRAVVVDEQHARATVDSTRDGKRKELQGTRASGGYTARVATP